MRKLEALILSVSQRSADHSNNAFQLVAAGFIAGPGGAKTGKDVE